MMEGKVLVVGGSKSKCHIIELLHKRGYYIIVADFDRQCEGRKLADRFIEISIDDVEGIVKVAKENVVDGILAVQSDWGMITANLAALEMGYKAISQNFIKLYTDKYSMRQYLKENGFLCPAYKKCRDISEVRQFSGENGFPFVVKPLNSQGSRGVAIIKGEQDFYKIEEAIAYTQNEDAVIAEEYLGSQEYTVEGIVAGGRHYTLAISKKRHYEDLECVSKELYYSWEQEYEDLQVQHDSLIDSTGLPFGLTHSEYIKTEKGFVLVEFAARGGGAMISSHIVPAVSGWDVEDMYACQVLGTEFALPERKKNYAVLKFIILKEGVIKGIYGIQQIQSMEHVLHFELKYHEGDYVNPVTNDTNRHGYYIAWADEEEELRGIMEWIEQEFQVVYEGE